MEGEELEGLKKAMYSKKKWEDLGISEEFKEILFSKGFKKPSRIQSGSLTFFLKKNTGDLQAQAKNGSGKTLAFMIPSIQIAHRNVMEDFEAKIPEPKQCSPYVIVLGDSKELCIQLRIICESIKLPKIETDFQSKGVDEINYASHITFMTFGNLDYMVKKRLISLKRLKLLVIDECDKILDNDRFLSNLQRIQKSFPKDTRMGIYSATYTEQTKIQISKLKRTFATIRFNNKEEIVLKNLTHYYIKCDRGKKLGFVNNFLNDFLTSISSGSVIIFVNHRAFAEKFAMSLNKMGHKSEILLGDMEIQDRMDIMSEFKQGKVRILLTTNLISRGIDNRKIGLVINLDMPVVYNKDRSAPRVIDKETYFHRVGRTGRFGDYGLALNVIDFPDLEEELSKIGLTYGIKMTEVTIDNFSDVIKKNQENYEINQQKREALGEDDL